MVHTWAGKEAEAELVEFSNFVQTVYLYEEI